MKFLILILTVTNDNILLKMKHKECNFMLTYKNLYCALVRSMSEAIDLYDAGKGILAREVLKKALLDAEDQDHLPRYHPRRTNQRRFGKRLKSAASAAMPRPQAVRRRAAVTRASR